MKKVRRAEDVEKALEEKGIEIRNGRGKTKEAVVDPRTWSRICWQEGEQFSEPRAAYFTGILKAFGIIGIFAGVIYLLSYFGV